MTSERPLRRPLRAMFAIPATFLAATVVTAFWFVPHAVDCDAAWSLQDDVASKMSCREAEPLDLWVAAGVWLAIALLALVAWSGLQTRPTGFGGRGLVVTLLTIFVVLALAGFAARSWLEVQYLWGFGFFKDQAAAGLAVVVMAVGYTVCAAAPILLLHRLEADKAQAGPSDNPVGALL